MQVDHPHGRWTGICAVAIFASLMARSGAQQLPGASSNDPGAGSSVAAAFPVGGGPRRAIMEVASELPMHTVFRPDDLADNAAKLPVVLFANGGCFNEGNRFRWFLSEIASYGFLVIATGPPGPSDVESGTPPLRVPAAAPGTAKIIPEHEQNPASRTQDLLRAMDWAIAQNGLQEGVYRDRIAANRIAVMGQSCGGIQALEASADSRVSTTIILSSGFFPQGATRMAGGKPMSQQDLKSLHAPIAYISGDDGDRAFSNANADFELIRSIPVLRAYERGISHAGTYWDQNGGEFAGVVIAWLQWQLQDDLRSALMFKGKNCGLCVNPRWVVQKKSID